MTTLQTVDRPRAAKHTAAHLGVEPAAESDKSILAGKRIVICEDEAVTQMQLHRALVRAGMQVVGVATNGVDAVSTTLRQRPDIVLMDIRMPGLDGIAATREICDQMQVCVIMLTAFSGEDSMGEAEKAGASGYIVKPITSDVLIPLLSQALSSYFESDTTSENSRKH